MCKYKPTTRVRQSNPASRTGSKRRRERNKEAYSKFNWPDGTAEEEGGKKETCKEGDCYTGRNYALNWANNQARNFFKNTAPGASNR